jgi:hypothetical protein
LKSFVISQRKAVNRCQHHELRSLLVFLCDLNVISLRTLYKLDLRYTWASYYERILGNG